MNALEAWTTLAALEMQEVEQASGLAGRGEQLRFLTVVEEQQARLLDRQQLDNGMHELVKQVDDVVVIDERVGEGHEPLRQQGVALARSLFIHTRDPFPRRLRRSTTALASSPRLVASAKAVARSTAMASSIVTSSCTMTMPAAWWTSAVLVMILPVGEPSAAYSETSAHI